MHIEIERKFVLSALPPDKGPGYRIRQGYLQANPARAVRIRTVEGPARTEAFLTVKGPAAPGHFSRYEFETPLELHDAEAMLALCELPPIEKTRYRYPWCGFVWELDAFTGPNAGLLLAEVELEHETQGVEIPPFVLREVTGDPRYFNLALAKTPFTTWPENNKEKP